MPVSGMAMDPCAKHGSKEGGNRDRSKPDSHITQRDAPTGRERRMPVHPLGSDADISLCGEKCAPVTPRAETRLNCVRRATPHCGCRYGTCARIPTTQTIWRQRSGGLFSKGR